MKQVLRCNTIWCDTVGYETCFSDAIQFGVFSVLLILMHGVISLPGMTSYDKLYRTGINNVIHTEFF